MSKFKFKYVYTKRSQDGESVIFECESSDILSADSAFKNETGLDPASQNTVGCQIVPILDCDT